MKEQTMINRIAMHLEDVLRHEASIPQGSYLEAARAILRTMRDLTPTMVNAGIDPDENIGSLGAVIVYTSMINAALTEAP